MNNTPLLSEADPQEVIVALKEALRERDVAMEVLREERDAYRKALEEIVADFPWSSRGSRAEKTLTQYPPIKDKQ